MNNPPTALVGFIKTRLEEFFFSILRRSLPIL
jgi:hypothetical protein